MTINWRLRSSILRVLAAVFAEFGEEAFKGRYTRIAKYYGPDATYDAIKSFFAKEVTRLAGELGADPNRGRGRFALRAGRRRTGRVVVDDDEEILILTRQDFESSSGRMNGASSSAQLSLGPPRETRHHRQQHSERPDIGHHTLSSSPTVQDLPREEANEHGNATSAENIIPRPEPQRAAGILSVGALQGEARPPEPSFRKRPHSATLDTVSERAGEPPNVRRRPIHASESFGYVIDQVDYHCALCQTQLPGQVELERHQLMSALHRRNLANPREVNQARERLWQLTMTDSPTSTGNAEDTQLVQPSSVPPAPAEGATNFENLPVAANADSSKDIISISQNTLTRQETPASVGAQSQIAGSDSTLDTIVVQSAPAHTLHLTTMQRIPSSSIVPSQHENHNVQLAGPTDNPHSPTRRPTLPQLRPKLYAALVQGFEQHSVPLLPHPKCPSSVARTPHPQPNLQPQPTMPTISTTAPVQFLKERVPTPRQTSIQSRSQLPHVIHHELSAECSISSQAFTETQMGPFWVPYEQPVSGTQMLPQAIAQTRSQALAVMNQPPVEGEMPPQVDSGSRNQPIVLSTEPGAEGNHTEAQRGQYQRSRQRAPSFGYADAKPAVPVTQSSFSELLSANFSRLRDAHMDFVTQMVEGMQKEIAEARENGSRSLEPGLGTAE